MEILNLIDQTVGTVQKLHKLSETISNIEFKQLLADLSGSLADTRLEVASLKVKVAQLTEENELLKKQTSNVDETPVIKWGCYKFEGDDTLYCIACYHKEKKKHPTSRVRTKLRHCQVCGKDIPN